MIDPLSLFGTILAVVQMIAMLAYKALDKRWQSKHKCTELAGRVKDLAGVLHEFPYGVANDMATVGIQGRLKHALDRALVLIEKCQQRGTYCCRKVTQLNDLNQTISECIMDLQLHYIGRPPPAPPVPDYNNYKQSACVGCLSPQHQAGSTSQPPYLQPPHVGWPSPEQHAASTSQSSYYYQPPHVGWSSPSPQQHAASTSQPPYWQPPRVDWLSPSPQQHAGSTSQPPYYQPPCLGWPSPSPQQHGASTSQPPYWQPPRVDWPSPSQQQHAASTSQPPYYQHPCVGWPAPSPVVFPALGYGCPTTTPGPGAYLTGTADRSAHSSSSALTIFGGSAYDIGQHSATSSGTNLELRDWKEKQLLEKYRMARADEDALNRALEESLASARPKEVAVNPLVDVEESLALTLAEDDMDGVVEKSLVLVHTEEAVVSRPQKDDVDRAGEEPLTPARPEEAVVNRLVEDSLALTIAEGEEGTMNRVLQESGELARAEEVSVNRLRTEEDATFNRAVQESVLSARVEGMDRDWCTALCQDEV